MWQQIKTLMKLTLNLLFTCFVFVVSGQNTVGLIDYKTDNLEGYVLFSPMTSNQTYLINKCGEKVHEWNTSTHRPALSSFLLEDGSLLRTGQLDNPSFDEGGSGGIIERFDWDGNLTWSYVISSPTNCQHHDIMPLPNGNILCVVWDSYGKQEAVAAGKDSSYSNPYLWSEKIVELQAIGTDSAAVVWEWKLWDHLVQDYDNSKPNFSTVSTHPELVNLNYFPGANNSPDWIHLNSVDYNATLDQILVSSHTFNEVWIIDHSTTTAEAASHAGGNSGMGGDLMYRWGNPQAYQRGNPMTKKFYGQHHATWIPEGYPNEGKIVVFNNGLNRPGTYSSVDVIEPPLNVSNNYTLDNTLAYTPNDLFWSYTATTPSDFYSSNISGVYPLENGSFLVTSGASGLFFEIDANKQNKWSYINPVSSSGIASQGSNASANLVFRANFYKKDYAGLVGQTLTSLGEIELNPSVPSLCSTILRTNDIHHTHETVQVYPNPVSDILHVSVEETADFTLELTNAQGKTLLIDRNNSQIDFSSYQQGLYFLRLRTNNDLIEAYQIIKR